MDFGQAVQELRNGRKVCRAGWNGKGMYIFLTFFPPFPGKSEAVDPCITMFTAQGTFQPGWLASQADILAYDWCIVEEVRRSPPHPEQDIG